jgi:ATP-dependent DNA helicase PIF1
MDVRITATTGVAARQIGGTTIHSAAGLGDGSKSVDILSFKIARSSKYVKFWQADAAIIDEVSMLDPATLEKMDAIGRRVRCNPDVPFGGLQLLLCGDFLQLPPVKPSDPRWAFAFDSPAWNSIIDPSTTINLTKIYRQSDAAFISVLNKMRFGIFDDECEQLLRPRVGVSPPPGTEPIRLLARNKDVKKINEERLRALNRDTVVCRAVTRLDPLGERMQGLLSQLRTMLPTSLPPKELELCEGALVLLVTNLDPDKGLVNGSRGIVTGFEEDENGNKFPIVNFYRSEEEGDLEVLIKPHRWKESRMGVGEVEYRQLPLKLAWAISIHKSQGMSLDHVVISLADLFEYGQGYVAASRARCLDTMYITSLDATSVNAHPKVVKYYKRIGATLEGVEIPSPKRERPCAFGGGGGRKSKNKKPKMQ